MVKDNPFLELSSGPISVQLEFYELPVDRGARTTKNLEFVASESESAA